LLGYPAINKGDGYMCKDDFEKIEKHLKHYKNYKIGMNNMKKQLEHLFPRITAAYEMREGSSGTFSNNSTTEDFAIKRAEKKAEMEWYIKTYELVTTSIDSALKQLDPLQKEFVEKRYIEGINMKSVASNLGYSLRQTYKIKEEVREQFLITLNSLTLIEL
jgi:hypothetical protein